MDSERNEGVEQRKTKLMNSAVSRLQREQKREQQSSTSAMEYRRQRNIKLLLRTLYCCAPYALVTIKELSLRPYPIYEQRNHNASAALLALHLCFLCAHATLLAADQHSSRTSLRYCRSRYKQVSRHNLLALKRLTTRFKMPPRKSKRQNHAQS